MTRASLSRSAFNRWMQVTFLRNILKALPVLHIRRRTWHLAAARRKIASREEAPLQREIDSSRKLVVISTENLVKNARTKENTKIKRDDRTSSCRLLYIVRCGRREWERKGDYYLSIAAPPFEASRFGEANIEFNEFCGTLAITR